MFISDKASCCWISNWSILVRSHVSVEAFISNLVNWHITIANELGIPNILGSPVMTEDSSARLHDTQVAENMKPCLLITYTGIGKKPEISVSATNTFISIAVKIKVLSQQDN